MPAERESPPHPQPPLFVHFPWHFPWRFPLVTILAALVVSTGCGRRAELLGTIFTTADDGGAPDAVSDAVQGFGAGLQFSSPTLVAAVSDPMAYDGDPSFTGDLLEMFFMSDRTGSKEIWTSRRARATDPWGPPSIVSALSSPGTDEGPSVSLDGSRIWFASDRDSPLRRIWQTSRASRNEPWAPPTAVGELASAADDSAPALDATELMIYFGSSRPTAQADDLFFSTRPSVNALWGAPKLVPGVNGTMDDRTPFVAQGGLLIIFTSTRSGAGDLYGSMRQSTADGFPSPRPLAELNSSAYESDPSLSQDLSYIMFDSQRTGNSEIYEAHVLR